MKLLVKPYYGWGWYDAAGNLIEVPDKFQMEVEVVEKGNPFQSVLGKVEEPEHRLKSKWVHLSQRHDPFDGECNLNAYDERPQQLAADISLSGFAQCKVLKGRT